MTITYSATDPNYISNRYALLKLLEKETTYVYKDTEGLATIGTGFLVSANAKEILQKDNRGQTTVFC